MKWQIWGKVGPEGTSFGVFEKGTTMPSGKTMERFMLEDGERLFHEFETPSELSPSVAGLMLDSYVEGFGEGEWSVERTCAIHSGQVHGREAEELRRGIEGIIKGMDEFSSEEWRPLLQNLLDEVDARDSLAYGETLEGKLHGDTRFMRRRQR